ncbi:hypothetical protein JM93_01821 [Roseibium hamelinense]|uniref:Uncharacterized protein n=1 Tax=Roseibium hamelinense TaxID=150831 RepID=A0A562T7M1_9HYPH|nr:hypothetical protein [Roseibium hamelinense]MTI43006.1 hypothetical protein [Roseibium hamelinense]TWI89617.1 hypothetical protein JM93_01821 [Roseibium hamelinense]
MNWFRSLMMSSVAAGMLTLAGPALATSNITCDAFEGAAVADILFGAGPVPAIIDVTVGTGNDYYTTKGLPDAVPLVIARAFTDAETVKIDLMDDQAERLLVSIRLLRSAGEEPLQIGYLQVGDEPPVGVTCIGP